MPVSPLYRPDPRFAVLGSEFADPVRAAEFPQSLIRFRNDRWAARVGLDTLDKDEWRAAFARFEPLPGQPQPLAMRYHGHQFQSYNPDIGDGRGFLYAQLREVGAVGAAGGGRLLDLSTKGSGRTPYSRSGDGRLTLKGGVREVLATAMLEALGVPTSKTFSLIETGEDLERSDEPSPTRSAVLTRLSYSSIRFGTFQRHAYFGHAEMIRQLVDHVIQTYDPQLADLDEGERPAALLALVVARTARLCARWMAAGFVHGVLNTDNMNINGESFDYGPYRFLPKNDPNFTAAYFDHQGLYAFGRQPAAVFWNVQQLAGCLALVSETDPMVEALNTFGPAYRDALYAAIVERLGLKPRGAEADLALASAAFKALSEGGETLRWEPFFFDWFGGEASAERAMTGPRAKIYDHPAFVLLRAAWASHEMDRPERLKAAYFANLEPEELLYDEIEALWAAVTAREDWAPLNAKLDRIDAARTAWGLAIPGES